MKNHIYVARSHENDLLDGDALPVLIPILNGAANSSLKNPKGLRDDNGPESMSGKATTFRWLTSLYWIWKNETITDTSIVGFYSEDKMLLDNFTTRTATEINYLNEAGNPNKEIRYSKSLIADCKDRILSDLKSLRFSLYDAVTPRPQFDLPVLSVRDCWNFFHDEELLKQAEEIVKNAFPSYHSAFEEVMSSSSPLMRDCIFIMKGKNFRSLCEFLFGVLLPLSSSYDISAEMKKREILLNANVIHEFDFACFFALSRILFPVWIMKNHIVCMDKWEACFI